MWVAGSERANGGSGKGQGLIILERRGGLGWNDLGREHLYMVSIGYLYTKCMFDNLKHGTKQNNI